MSLPEILYVVKATAALWALGFLYVFFFQGHNPSQKADKASKLVLSVTLSAALPTIGLGTQWDLEGFGIVSWGFPWVSTVGLALIVAGVVLHVTAVIQLGRQWSGAVVIQEGHRIVDTGIYGVVRHPIYAAIVLELIGFGVALSHPGVLVLLLVPNVAALVYRIRVEERALGEHFGPQWAEYTRKTKRMVPGFF